MIPDKNILGSLLFTLKNKKPCHMIIDGAWRSFSLSDRRKGDYTT